MARKSNKVEPDSVFLLKLVIYTLLGVMWLQIDINGTNLPIPFGLFVGVFLAHHEHFTIDRKIEFAVLLFAALSSYLFPIGFVLAI